jgi:hypothetical protein
MTKHRRWRLRVVCRVRFSGQCSLMDCDHHQDANQTPQELGPLIPWESRRRQAAHTILSGRKPPLTK